MQNIPPGRSPFLPPARVELRARPRPLWCNSIPQLAVGLAGSVPELGQMPMGAFHGAWEPSTCPKLMSLQWATM